MTRTSFAPAVALSLSIALLASCVPIPSLAPPCTPPTPQRVLIVIEENKAFSEIIANPDAPYINRLASEGALFTSSFAVTHPSQPNYIAFFSGSTNGVSDNAAHSHDEFTAPNLGSKLLAAGHTFAGYSDSLPETGFDGPSAGDDLTGLYERKHNPWVNWQDASVPLPPNKLPPSVNRPFTDFPADFAALPTVAIVVPNQKHDMHDGSIAEGDAWLEQHIAPYVAWADSHDALLILTFDEDDGREFNRIVTIFHGPMIQPGHYAQPINHYTVLRTLEEMFALPHTANTDSSGPIPCVVWQAK